MMAMVRSSKSWGVEAASSRTHWLLLSVKNPKLSRDEYIIYMSRDVLRFADVPAATTCPPPALSLSLRPSRLLTYRPLSSHRIKYPKQEPNLARSTTHHLNGYGPIPIQM